MAIFFVLVCSLIFVAIASYVHYARRRQGEGQGGGYGGGHAKAASPKLPPGSMGWPYLGETLQLYSENPKIFFAARLKR